MVRGISTEMVDNGPFRQITTRRTSLRQGRHPPGQQPLHRPPQQPARSRGVAGRHRGLPHHHGRDEALIGYSVEVTATRQDEINGRAIVNAVIQPTFSIDFVAVTLVLQ